MVLTEQYKKIGKQYIVRNNKVLIKFKMINKKTDSNLILPDSSNKIGPEDRPKYWAEHIFQGLVIGVGSDLRLTEPSIQIGKVVYLRQIPGDLDTIQIENEIFYSIDPSMILCTKQV